MRSRAGGFWVRLEASKINQMAAAPAKCRATPLYCPERVNEHRSEADQPRSANQKRLKQLFHTLLLGGQHYTCTTPWTGCLFQTALRQKLLPPGIIDDRSQYKGVEAARRNQKGSDPCPN